MKKKVLALLLCGILGVSGLTACGSKEEPAADAPATETPAAESQGEESKEEPAAGGEGLRRRDGAGAEI